MRGQGQFDPGALIEKLGDDLVPTAAADQYREFYGLRGVARKAEHRLALREIAGQQIVVQLLRPTDACATAVVSHGYYDHTGLYGHLIEFLVDQGLAVLAFDQPGHGLSSGPRASIGSFDAYVDVLTAVLAELEQLPGPHHLVGQSMGGAVAMEYLARSGVGQFGEVILFAPLTRPYQWPLVKWAYRAARLATLQSRPRTLTDNAENEEFLGLMRADPLQADSLPVQWVRAMVEWMAAFERHTHTGISVRMIQGDDDKTVDARWGIETVGSKFDVDLLVVPGGRHHLVNESVHKRETMWRWLEERCVWGD
ncbi:MAG: alpha/beta hydrolase [Pseudomonadales bacterium]|jgi:alpha-beta hydrolase superfamily lysophospholipase|nr:alpha/beta hydrolase [Pseudomonadales bacterium]MDP6469476.1 alpha/beta hydrolase [Pseudomonadales bacterium]MDP6827318.1 alpha/beta hydrolase [Pseudomonadales bacterium]MDP6971141.1 alpha/beta hydrolase [Pseudomonadales bacterium]|tara:strand:+ start:45 stop:974 length:930 start_codon:yes stop_codon:yes gene_type:complete